MSPVVDAHQHFWTYGTYQTSWMEAPPYAGDSAFQPLRRSFEPGDLAPELQAAGVGYTVAIEAADGQSARPPRRAAPAEPKLRYRVRALYVAPGIQAHRHPSR